MTLRPFALEASGLTLRGLRADGHGQPRVLALHGWLDNAASFVPLAACLPAVELVLLDLPGHGQSDHLPADVPYTGVAAINQVLGAADALGWDRFHLLGHSMGAGIASLVAAAVPDRVQGLVAIEGLGGLAGDEHDTTTRLRDALTAARTLGDRPLRVFPDLIAPVRARMRVNQLSQANARLLVERGVTAVPGGYQWSSDPRLTLPTPIRLSEGQIRDLLAHIHCPAQVIFATPAPAYFPETLRSARAALLANGRVVHLPGTHHLHMEQPQIVGGHIGHFLAGMPSGS